MTSDATRRLPDARTSGPSARYRQPFYRSNGFSAALFLLPATSGFLLFVCLPVLAAFAIAFFQWDLVGTPQFIGLKNFAALLKDRVFLAALWNTAYYTVGVVTLSVSLGLVAAILVNRAIRGIGVARVLLAMPYVTVTVAMAIVWRWIYQPEVGLMNALLAVFGIPGPNWLSSRVWAMPALILMGVWKSFGYNMILFIAGLQAVPASVYEAAAIDGATGYKRFVHVTLPLLSPVLFFITVISIISSFEVFDSALVMTGGGPGTATTTLVLYIYEAGFESFHFGYASAIALSLFAVVLVVTLAQLAVQRRWVSYD